MSAVEATTWSQRFGFGVADAYNLTRRYVLRARHQPDVVIGTLLVSQIAGGILDAKRRAAVAQASVGLETARRQLAAVAGGDVAGVVQAIDQTFLSKRGVQARAALNEECRDVPIE